ncbi:helix-turn-helix domain-containing protein [Aerococcus christensenii]|nr:AraC family transcriptional regulator [Aerococcus christensenii]MDK8233399.1 AraC family transcriptional regulator [Aerococcus christensenii]
MSTTIPYRIKVTPLRKEQFEIYNRSLYHRKELLFVIRPFRLLINQNEVALNKQQILVLPSTINAQFILEENIKEISPIYAYLFSIGEPYLETITDSFVTTPELQHLFLKLQRFSPTPTTFKHLLTIVREMDRTQYFKKSDLQQKRLYALTCQLLIDISHLSTHEGFQITNRPHPQLAEAIRHYIDENYQAAIRLSDLKELFSCSQSTLNRIFEQNYHSTIHQYIIKRRIEYAHEMITLGHPIKESWQSAGFNDYSSFYRAFKKFYKYPPHLTGK